jgi:uncharacterized damage-inducible protein DinB
MTKLIVVLLLAASLVWAADPKMTPEDRAKVVKYLKDSHQQLLDSVAKLSDAQWKYQPSPERWSVAQTVEHIYLAEGLLFGAMQKALDAPANPDWEAKTKGKTEFLERVMVDRSRKATAPESIVPAGKYSRSELMRLLKDARAKTLKFAQQTDLPLQEHTFDHAFPVFNTLNAYQWLIYIPLHNLRHNQQVEEVKASEGFPK